jgi:hypothetical protein
MSLQIHGIVKDTNDLDTLLSFDMKEDKVASAIAIPGSMQGIEALGDVRARSCPCDGRAFAQTCDGVSQNIFIELGMFFAEPVGGP